MTGYDLYVVTGSAVDGIGSPTTTYGSVTGDPHVHGGHGDTYDVHGVNGGVYNALSGRNVSMNIQVKDDTFRTPYSKLTVHGSWIHDVYWVVRTLTGRILRIAFNGEDPHHFRVGQKNGSLVAHSAPLSIDEVKLSLQAGKMLVETFNWKMDATATKGAPHWGKLRMNIGMRQLHVCSVAPHGLVAQTFDEDKKPINGKRDSYSVLDNGMMTKDRKGVGGVVTSRAKGEGAIEGSMEDYRMPNPFAVSFRFSRFDSAYSPTRNITAIKKF